MKYLTYIFFRALVFKFKFIPFPLLYIFSDVLRFFFKYILRYRVGVIQKNIEFCFPDKSDSEKQQIFHDFYKNFIDIILESIKGLGADPHKLVSRFKFTNPEVLNQFYENNQHVIAYSQHYNNWEWGPITLGLQVKHHIVGIVKFLSNSYMNDYFITGRSGNNVSVIPTHGTGRFFNQLDSKKPNAIVFIADQLPRKKERSVNLKFLGKDTLFHNGAAHYAQKSNFPLVSFDVHRYARGQYNVEITLLHTSPSDLSIPEITTIYKNHLEQLIHQSPHSWLWSHKRFKESIRY